MAQTDPQASKAVRAHETRIEIDAPIEDVWRALTEAREIERWFAPKMNVEPGAGGSMVADWGPGLEWKNAIEVWEPNRPLRLTETRDHMLTPPGVNETMVSCRLFQDYYLEAEGGKTVLLAGNIPPVQPGDKCSQQIGSPVTPRHDVTEVLHCVILTDPYR
jgi:uncharacterized protein YndB with AHSA1/START domain